MPTCALRVHRSGPRSSRSASLGFPPAGRSRRGATCQLPGGGGRRAERRMLSTGSDARRWRWLAAVPHNIRGVGIAIAVLVGLLILAGVVQMALTRRRTRCLAARQPSSGAAAGAARCRSWTGTLMVIPLPESPPQDPRRACRGGGRDRGRCAGRRLWGKRRSDRGGTFALGPARGRRHCDRPGGLRRRTRCDRRAGPHHDGGSGDRRP